MDSQNLLVIQLVPLISEVRKERGDEGGGGAIRTKSLLGFEKLVRWGKEGKNEYPPPYSVDEKDFMCVRNRTFCYSNYSRSYRSGGRFLNLGGSNLE